MMACRWRNTGWEERGNECGNHLMAFFFSLFNTFFTTTTQVLNFSSFPQSLPQTTQSFKKVFIKHLLECRDDSYTKDYQLFC